MRLKDGFVLREVCGRQVLMGEGLAVVDFGKLLELNEPAAWLWETARKMGEFTTEELVEKLCEEYNVDSEEARQDITEMLTEWQNVGLLSSE